MKALIVVVSLTVLSSSQAVAGKRFSFLREWKTPSSAVFMPRISRNLIAGGLSTTLFSAAGAALLPEVAAVSLGAAGIISVAAGVAWGFGNGGDITEIEQVDTQVLYLDEAGALQYGKVVSATARAHALRVAGQAEHPPLVYDGRELQVERQLSMNPIDFKIYFRHKHRDTYRPVEILSEAGNAEAPRQVGRVVNVFHDGFYELELLVEVNPSQPDEGHVAIEPYRIIVNENVALEDGGFRFSDQ